MATVLIVDDDAATLESLSEALELSGFEVAAASSGPEALELVRRRRPAAVLVDYRMPQMSGVEVIAHLRAMPGLEDLCVIVASAWPELPQDLDPSAIVVEKPFSIDTLVQLLERCGVRASGATPTCDALPS